MLFELGFLEVVGVYVLLLVFDVVNRGVFLKCAFWYGKYVGDCSKHQ
jgi:hypothetical protein